MKFRMRWFATAVPVAVLVLASASAAFAAGGAAGGADLQVSGSASTGSPNAGSSYSYTFQVKNSGPESAASTFSATLPVGVEYNFATVNGASASCAILGPVVSCDLSTLASGSQATVAVNAYAPATVGTFSVTGTTASGTADPSAANNSATGGQMLIKASSSDTTARLFAYRPDGTYIGEVQNGGGSRYGGTVMPYQFSYSVTVTIRSSSGGSITVPTTPFQI